MASTFSFDVVSDYDEQELTNAIDQTNREVATRYDLKSTNTEIEQTSDYIEITTDTDFTLSAVRDVLESKVIRRGLSLKVLDPQEVDSASGGKVRQRVNLKRGIPEDLAKKIAKQIRSDFKKVSPQIQGDAVRVQSKSKDDLQDVMQALKQQEHPVALQFVNFR